MQFYIVSRVCQNSFEWSPLSAHTTPERAQEKVAKLIAKDGKDFGQYRIDVVAREN